MVTVSLDLFWVSLGEIEGALRVAIGQEISFFRNSPLLTKIQWS